MVKVGFVVEGHCEKMLLESSHFRYWAEKHSIDICDPIINARGGGNLCQKKIDASITECGILASPDKINDQYLWFLNRTRCQPLSVP